MKGFATAVLLAIACAPGAASAQSGHVHGSPQGGPAGTPNSTGTMRPDDVATSTSSRSGIGGAGGASGARFKAIAHGRRYITRAQAKRYDPVLYRHFRRCDTLRDGRVTRTEFKNCHGGRKP